MMHGEAGEAILRQIEAFAFDFARLILEVPFGEIYSRPGLEPRTRQLVTVSALIALGSAPTQLKRHLCSALKLGWMRDELLEVIMQLSIYAGFPAASITLSALQETLEDGAESASAQQGAT
jgi:4-carboxymuconolactone decarboxylase